MRILVIIGGAVAAAFVLAAILLAVMVDPNKYKGDITRLVKEKYQRELVFEGDVKLAFFPRLGVQTAAVRLGNAPGFGEAPFARVNSASVSVRLLPLLTGKVEVGRVLLDGLVVNLAKNEQGVANWADFSGPEDPAQAEAAKKTDAAASVSGFRLDGLRVRDASIAWEDRMLGERYAVTGASVDVKAIKPGQPFDFEAAFLFESAKPELKAQTQLSGTATLNAGDDRHVFSNLNLKVSATGKAVPGGKGEFAFGLAEFKLDLKQHTAQGAGLTLAAYGAKVTGQFQATNLQDGADIKGRLDIPDFNGRELSAALTGKAPDTADAAAYQHITAAIEFKTGKGYTEITNFTASLDDARVEGRFRVTGLEKKAYTFNLRISGLDADRFLPTKKAETPAPEPAKAAPGAEAPKDEVFPVKTLREMKLDGQITAERFKVKGLRFVSLKVPMMAQDGVLDIGQVEARMYDGSLKGSLRLDVQGDRPVATLSCQVAGMQQKPLLSDLSGKESQFAGTMNLDTLSPLVAQGNTVPALKRSLNGRVRINVRDGVFPGVNVLGVVRDSGKKAKDLLTGADSGADKSTKFGSIDATAAITNGVAAINDLDFKAPFLRGEGKGTVDIASKQTDYTLNVRVVPSAEGQGGSAGLIGLVVPLRITGPYDNLSYSTDYLRAIGKGAVDAVGGVVQGIGNVVTGKKSSTSATPAGATPQKKSSSPLDAVKKLF